jgi:hypothetical protein
LRRYASVRSTVPKINLDDLFTTKEEIAKEVKVMLEKAMTVGLYKLNPLDPQLETARLQPLSLPLDPS